MPVRNYKTNRAARKNMSVIDRRDLSAGKPHRSLVVGRKRLNGRGSQGIITVRHRGGGAKRLWRVVDFRQDKKDIPAKVEKIEYDPNRSAFLALLLYRDGERRYVVSWEGAREGDEIVVSDKAPEKPGNRMALKAITPGTAVFNVELKPGRGGQILRAAGASAVLMDVKGGHAQLKMPSGEIRLIAREAYATIGEASNADAWLERAGSAGRMRRRGRRPQVRGKAMNPVDHPHGGGEGAQPIGLKHPKTLWGKPALGVKTRRKGKYSDSMILKRRTKKKRR
ncbi:MAG: 50S ribosomal protein L2 [Candidatus Andersenbacteria bacterium]|nr:50S ribosomal protein L2 [bacterium]MDZ4225752.1 50S ribosomal protein L2 [Candidatus Andersenbacteria bacterium]